MDQVGYGLGSGFTPNENLFRGAPGAATTTITIWAGFTPGKETGHHLASLQPRP